MSQRDKEKVTLICVDCGRSFELSYGRYRRFPKDHDWRCKECQLIYRSNWYNRLSPEEQKAISEKKSKAAIKVWENMSSEEYNKRCKSQKTRWNKLSSEEKERVMSNTRKALKKYMNRPEVKAKLIERNIKRWNDMSDEERRIEIERLNKIRNDHWNSLTDNEKFNKMKKMWDSLSATGPTEFNFKSLLERQAFIENIDYKWGYSTYPFIHPDYYNTFGTTNSVTGESNFPYHVWDFIVYNKNGNNLLIDLDGSAHDKKNMNFKRKGNSYTEREKIDYNDSQRSYQVPDNMDAYIVMCYNDKLEDTTSVLSLTSSKIILFRDLMNIIKFTQFSKKSNNS